MNNRKFAEQLQQELPRWQREGWVSAEAGQAILADIGAQQPKAAWASALALAGALLLGVGVITWFAAHWGEMSKLLKLMLIFLALIGSHIAHGLCLRRDAMPRLAEGMGLLSVLFFGAAIMLIGQIYHIDAHFPDGVALWAAGALLTAWLFGSQPALLGSIALAAIWTWTEQFDYRVMNWPLLGYLMLAAVPLVRNDWKLAARCWGVLLLLWIIGWHMQPWSGTDQSSHAHVQLFALQVLGIAGCWALVQSSEHAFARALRADFLAAALIASFVFTFPDFAHRRGPPVGDLTPWLAALAAAVALYAAGILCLVRTSKLTGQRLIVGLALASSYAVLLATELLMPRNGALLALCWNFLFLGVLYWIVDMGVRRGEPTLVNQAFAGFAVWVLARYFDTFWTLFDRAIFFMVGGLLLLAGGGWLERRRRALLRQFEHGEQP